MEERKIFSWKRVTVYEQGRDIVMKHHWSNDLDDTYITLSFDAAWLEVAIEEVSGYARRVELLIPVKRVNSVRIEHG